MCWVWIISILFNWLLGFKDPTHLILTKTHPFDALTITKLEEYLYYYPPRRFKYTIIQSLLYKWEWSRHYAFKKAFAWDNKLVRSKWGECQNFNKKLVCRIELLKEEITHCTVWTKHKHNTTRQNNNSWKINST